PDETFNVQLTSATNAIFATAVAAGTILDDDEPPALAIDDVTVSEGAPGDGVEAVFTLSLSLASGKEIRVDAATVAGTAAAGSDFAATGGTVILPPGVTVQTFSVPVLGDLIDEHDETFNVELSSPVNVTLADASGLATILDDDDPPVLSVTNATITEAPGAEL
ncbi:MAG: hypothetical protein GY716_06680, partial [bacterium]|nr:hypothetical protein [bacterium]